LEGSKDPFLGNFGKIFSKSLPLHSFARLTYFHKDLGLWILQRQEGLTSFKGNPLNGKVLSRAPVSPSIELPRTLARKGVTNSLLDFAVQLGYSSSIVKKFFNSLPPLEFMTDQGGLTLYTNRDAFFKGSSNQWNLHLDYGNMSLPKGMKSNSYSQTEEKGVNCSIFWPFQQASFFLQGSDRIFPFFKVENSSKHLLVAPSVHFLDALTHFYQASIGRDTAQTNLTKAKAKPIISDDLFHYSDIPLINPKVFSTLGDDTSNPS